MATIYVFDMDLLMRLYDSTETRLHALKNFLPNRVEQVKKFRKSRSKRLKKRINSVSLQPKSFLIEVKQRIVCTRVYTQFDGLSKTNKFLVLTVVYCLVIIVMMKYPLPLPPLNRFLKRKIKKAQRTNLSTHIMAYIPVDRAKRNRGRALFLGVNIATFGVGILLERIWEQSEILTGFIEGTAAGLSSFVILNYQLLGDFVPEQFRERFEPIIEKLATPSLSLPASFAVATPFWVRSFKKIYLLENAYEGLLEGQEKLIKTVDSLENSYKLLKEHQEKFLSQEKIAKAKNIALEFMLRESESKTAASDKLLELLEGRYMRTRDFLVERLSVTETNCLTDIFNSLVQDNPLRQRVIRGLDSYVFSEKEGRYVLEGSIREIIASHCKEYYEQEAFTLVGPERYQQKVFEKMSEIVNHYGGYTSKRTLEVLPIESLILGAADTASMPNPFQIALNAVDIGKDVHDMVDQKLKDEFDLL